MTISPEAKEATNRLLNFIGDIELPFGTSLESDVSIQLAINSATAPAIQSAKDSAANFRKSEVKRIEAEREVTKLQKEIERLTEELKASQWNAGDLLKQRNQLRDDAQRLRGEVEKAYREGYSDFGDVFTDWNNSRAKQVVEGVI